MAEVDGARHSGDTTCSIRLPPNSDGTPPVAALLFDSNVISPTLYDSLLQQVSAQSSIVKAFIFFSDTVGLIEWQDLLVRHHPQVVFAQPLCQESRACATATHMLGLGMELAQTLDTPNSLILLCLPPGISSEPLALLAYLLRRLKQNSGWKVVLLGTREQYDVLRQNQDWMTANFQVLPENSFACQMPKTSSKDVIVPLLPPTPCDCAISESSELCSSTPPCIVEDSSSDDNQPMSLPLSPPPPEDPLAQLATAQIIFTAIVKAESLRRRRTVGSLYNGVALSQVEQTMSVVEPSFSWKSCGHKKFSDFILSHGEFFELDEETVHEGMSALREPLVLPRQHAMDLLMNPLVKQSDGRIRPTNDDGGAFSYPSLPACTRRTHGMRPLMEAQRLIAQAVKELDESNPRWNGRLPSSVVWEYLVKKCGHFSSKLYGCTTMQQLVEMLGTPLTWVVTVMNSGRRLEHIQMSSGDAPPMPPTPPCSVEAREDAVNKIEGEEAVELVEEAAMTTTMDKPVSPTMESKKKKSNSSGDPSRNSKTNLDTQDVRSDILDEYQRDQKTMAIVVGNGPEENVNGMTDSPVQKPQSLLEHFDLKITPLSLVEQPTLHTTSQEQIVMDELSYDNHPHVPYDLSKIRFDPLVRDVIVRAAALVSSASRRDGDCHTYHQWIPAADLSGAIAQVAPTFSFARYGCAGCNHMCSLLPFLRWTWDVELIRPWAPLRMGSLRLMRRPCLEGMALYFHVCDLRTIGKDDFLFRAIMEEITRICAERVNHGEEEFLLPAIMEKADNACKGEAKIGGFTMIGIGEETSFLCDGNFRKELRTLPPKGVTLQALIRHVAEEREYLLFPYVHDLEQQGLVGLKERLPCDYYRNMCCFPCEAVAQLVASHLIRHHLCHVFDCTSDVDDAWCRVRPLTNPILRNLRRNTWIQEIMCHILNSARHPVSITMLARQFTALSGVLALPYQYGFFSWGDCLDALPYIKLTKERHRDSHTWVVNFGPNKPHNALYDDPAASGFYRKIIAHELEWSLW